MIFFGQQSANIMKFFPPSHSLWPVPSLIRSHTPGKLLPSLASPTSQISPLGNFVEIMACQSDSGLRLRLCSPDGLLLYFHYMFIYHLDSLNMSYDNQKAQIKQGKLMQKVGLDPHEGRELGRAD